MYFPTLKSIASHDVLTIPYGATIQDAIDNMHAHDHRSIIVVNHRIYYVLTTADLIEMKLCNTDFSNPLSSLPLKQAPTLNEAESVINAVDIVREEGEYLCLIDEESRLTGIVSNSDIVGSIDPQIMLKNLTLQSLFEKRYSYMVTDVDTSMRDAITLLNEASHDSIIVTEYGRPAGIITTKDILRCMKSNTSNAKVRDYMSAPLQTLTEGTQIEEALEFMKQKHFKRIVVADADENISGIVSQQELIAQSYLHWSHLIKEHYHEIEEVSQILEQRNRQLLTLATKDRLTGISNRHMFEEQFKKEQAFAQRYNVPLHLMILDIDFFKSVNDTHGHIIGDAVLQEFAQLIETSARNSDVFARWGGEEFVLLMHNGSETDSVALADKLRERIADHSFGTAQKITCSIGICPVDPAAPLTENLSRADQALYTAKKAGRNRVSLYNAPAD